VQIKERKVSKSELDRIYEDFTKIEIADGIPQRKTERYEFTAEENGSVIGYVSGITEHKWFYLTDLWVDETFRRHGLGSKLLKLIEQKAAGAGMEHIYLWTAGLINPIFYEKHGYTKFAVLEDKFEIPGYHQIGFRKDLVK